MAFRTLDDLDLNDKRVLIRVDVNAPMQDGRVTDDTRIRAVAPTIQEVLARGGRPVLLAHFGRPKGERVPEMSLSRIRGALEEIVGAHIAFRELDDAAEAAAALRPNEALLVENLRFDPGEEANDPAFARRLAALGDVYVNDAFSTAHRAHASTEGVARLLPSAAGRLMERELKALEAALANPKRPVVAVVGGAKVSTKLALLANLIDKVDHIVIGGGMANTFLAAEGKPVGKSLCEHDLLETAREIAAKAAARGCELALPSDVVAAERFEADAPHRTVSAEACPAEAMILDAGPETVARIERLFRSARTIVWNGPLGAFELTPFNAATDAAARIAADLAVERRVLAVAGGGDTVAALNNTGVAEKFSYVSTAGGAFLEWLEGKTLPGVAALQTN